MSDITKGKLRRFLSDTDNKVRIVVGVSVALIVGVVGYTIINVAASGFFVASEPDQGVLTTNAISVNDSSAADGKVVQFTLPAVPAPPPPPPPPAPTGKNCMDLPSACGYPDSTNTGVPAGTSLIGSTGDRTFSAAGTYSGLDIHGCVTITATGVTLTKSRITGCSGSYAVRVDSSNAGFVLSDSEIVMQGDQKGLVFVGYTAQRVKVTGTGDCFGTGTNSVILDSYCENGPGGSPKRAPTYGNEPSWCESSGAHWDGVESGATTRTIIRHNTFRLPCGQTATINVSDWNGPISGMVADNNLLAGGSWVVYCGSPTVSMTLTNNRFSRWYWQGGGSANNDEATQGYCWTAVRSGNVWDDTLLPV